MLFSAAADVSMPAADVFCCGVDDEGSSTVLASHEQPLTELASKEHVPASCFSALCTSVYKRV